MINRIVALIMRYQNIALGSVPRLLAYLSSVQIYFGFFTNYFYQINEDNMSTLNIILSAVVLWDVYLEAARLSMSF